MSPMLLKGFFMSGVTAIYQGRIVDKKHFRTFVYAMDGSKKLVDSWDEYQKAMASGLWFSTKEDATARIPVPKPRKTGRKAKEKDFEQAMDELKESKESDDIEPEDLAFDVVSEKFDVLSDDFLPK